MKERLLCVISCFTATAASQILALPDGLQRFPADFAWGSATAAYQVEGLKHYRLSLSWPRLLPHGRGTTFNAEGLTFYNSIFSLLNQSGIQPLVTLYHWDIPQALEDEYGGWRSEAVVDDFAKFADMAFAAFGRYVKRWLTFNEALTFVGEGYGDGVHAPGRCSDRDRCEEGDSNLEPILVAHNVLLAHASAVAKFRQRFLGRQGYEIGMTNCGFMTYPLRESDTERNQEFLEAEWAWFFDPVIYGDYPESIKKRVGSAMPSFTPEQSAMLKGSIDFLGVNYYTSRWVSVPDETHDASLSANGIPFLNSMFSVTAYDDNLIPIGSQAGSEWLYIVPEGIHDLLIWLAARYPANPVTGKSYELRITENGLSLPWWLELTEDDSLNDTFRVDYYRAHIEEVARAISEGVRVTAYYAWSLMDNYEWADGYSKRFGIVYVDYGTLTRIPKLSAWWYSALIDAHAATHRLGPPTTSGSTVLASFMSKRTTALAGPVGVIVVASMLAFVLAVQRNKGTKAMSMRIELPVLFSTKAIQGHERNGYNRIP